ncbi:hypothetical protein LTR94_030960, partial [Friedmanniomyces endolithicus]
MDVSFVQTPAIQDLLDRVAGTASTDGNPRVKAIMRDLVEATMTIIAAGEFGLLMPGTGIEHFLDLYMDAKDAEAGKTGGTPRTIEGPLYVEGAPLVENDANLTDDPDETTTLYMTGQITGPDGEAVKNAILHVWHADSRGFYSHFDPTHEQTPFNNRRRIKLGDDGRYSFHSKMPN